MRNYIIGLILIALSVYILISFLIFKLDLNYYSFLLFRFMQTGSSCVGIVLSIAIIKDIAPQKDLFKIISFVPPLQLEHITGKL